MSGLRSKSNPSSNASNNMAAKTVNKGSLKPAQPEQCDKALTESIDDTKVTTSNGGISKEEMIAILDERFKTFEKRIMIANNIKYTEIKQLLDDRIAKQDARIFDLENSMDQACKKIEEVTEENKELKSLVENIKTNDKKSTHR